jgi:hypothetical protein
MALNEAQFIRLFKILAQIDLFGSGPPKPPWGSGAPTLTIVRQAIEGSAAALPPVYQSDYVAPLDAHLETALARSDAVSLETLAGAVYDHGQAGVKDELHRFLAVVSNFYRSFLSSKRRARVDFPLTEQLPPLAMFQSIGDFGPFTITVDSVHALVAAPVGVVSLPSVYRDHPVLWASLAHETGGHDVVAADVGLIDELREGVKHIFGGGPIGRGGRPNLGQFLGILWSFWMDEAVADVYGVLNIGPTFGHNLVAFFAALNERQEPTGRPSLRTASGHPSDSPVLDPHPTDILRPALIAGAVESLVSLSQQTRDQYVADLQQLATLTGGGAANVVLQGIVPTGPGVGIQVNTRLPLDRMQAAARIVGAFIASVRLHALGDHNIQELETWDNTDEQSAVTIAEAIGANRRVAGAGDDAQLLAGATLALLEKADGYDKVSRRLDEALDFSFETDPIWGVPSPDAAYIKAEFLPDDSPDLALYVDIQV